MWLWLWYRSVDSGALLIYLYEITRSEMRDDIDNELKVIIFDEAGGSLAMSMHE
jgi:hypothetical protein